jgi:flagellar biosynthesis anti-sigma factor FlgM
MKINPITISNVQSAYKTGKANRTAAASVSSGHDEITLSDESVAFAKVLANAKEKLTAAEKPDEDTIARLKSAIAAGEYKVSSTDVAESILSALITNP